MQAQPHYGICETEPRPDCFNKSNCLCAEKWKPYRESLQRAKESSVPIQDQDAAKRILNALPASQFLSCCPGDHSFNKSCLMSGKVYGPFTVEYEIHSRCCANPNLAIGACERDCDAYESFTGKKGPSKVAILLPEKEPQEYNIEALRKELAECKQAYNQQLERNAAIAKDLEYWAQKSADLLKELEAARKQ